MPEYKNVKCRKCKKNLADLVDDKISDHTFGGMLQTSEIILCCSRCGTGTTFHVEQYHYFIVTRKE